MPAERFFAPLPHTSLTGEECRHLIRVMRARVGDTIELIDGKGTLTTAEITAIDKERCLLRPLKQHHFPPTLPPLILAQALPRQNRLDTIVEKGTELGMSTLWLFPGDRSEKKGVSLERLTAITIAATKQCGRLHLPTIALMPPLTEWENLPTPTYYGTLAPNAPSL
ncbi:MAG: 16S rRNA (uracil(1498)-N(3))-methyltransferase, partial [Chlamydiia bacterium]|nr:16S rRNA (uracil(1498)-N(3))-methyltransferase [Chlamydiia bacterium]